MRAQFLDFGGKEKFACPNVATGWAEFLKALQARMARGPIEPAAAWAVFEQFAQTSPRAAVLGHLMRLGHLLPENERYQLGVLVADLLRQDWPEEWELFRPGLVSALAGLAAEMNPDSVHSYFNHIATVPGAETRRMAYLSILAAQDLLAKPRRDQIRTVAMLCNAGFAVCINTSRQLGKMSDSRDIERFGLAIAGYTAAADLLNNATGAVLFEGLHAPLWEEV